jgi:hypothetical protein
MNYLAQSTLAAVLVIGAATYLAGKAWRAVQSARQRSSGGCGPDCGCG